jgi:hypothetical protein
MADAFPSRVAANILPLSKAQALPAAFYEWAWTGVTEDHERATERCHLCEQESLRYHFEIRNGLTDRTLQVGSKCILRWQMGVVAGGVRLAPAAAKARINAAVKRMQRDACERALREILAKEPHPVLQGALDAYLADKPLTPKQIQIAFWRLDEAAIEYHPSFFRVDLKKARRVEDLRTMPDYQRTRVWKAMTSTQRKTAIGHDVAVPSGWKESH